MLFDFDNDKNVSPDDIMNIIFEDTKVNIDENIGFNDIEVDEIILPKKVLTESAQVVDDYTKPETYIELYVKCPTEGDLLTELRESNGEDMEMASRLMNFLVKEEDTKMFYEKFNTYRAVGMDIYACKLLGEACGEEVWKEKYYIKQFEFMLEALKMPNLKKQWLRDLKETEQMVKEAVCAAYSAGGPQSGNGKYNKYLGVEGDLANKCALQESIIDNYTDLDIDEL